MGLLPEGASFEEQVQDYFLAFRGEGVMLSALDAALVIEWSRTGVPFEVVARGIRKAAERALWDARPGEPALRTLRHCRRDVEGEIAKHRARSPGAHAPVIAQGAEDEESAESGGREAASRKPVSREAKIARALKALVKTRPELSPRAASISARLHDEPSPTDDAILLGLLRALPFSERRALRNEGLALIPSHADLSVRARRLSRRFHLCAMTRRHLDLPSFW